MGRIQDFFGKLLRKENTPPALPEGVAEKTFEEKKEEFKNNLNTIKELQKTKEIEVKDENIIEYNPKNFLKHPKWRAWYGKAEDRNMYYDSYKPQSSQRVSYNGALSIIPISKTMNRIVCTCVNEERKPYTVELGKTKRKLLSCSNARN